MAGQVYGRDRAYGQTMGRTSSLYTLVAQVDAHPVLDLPIVDAHQSDLIDHCNKVTRHFAYPPIL
jgi:hypothetical protein